MPNFFSKFTHTDEYAPEQKIAGEATARLPYAVFAPAVVTHFPLFHTSQENELIDRGQESEIFRRRRDQIRSFLLEPKEKNFSKSMCDPLIESFEHEFDTSHVRKFVEIIWIACCGVLEKNRK